MDLSKLVSISGKPGLFKVVANRDNGLIVEDFDSGKKRFVSGRAHQFTPLESISIYTNSDTEELKAVFASMRDKFDELPPVSNKASAIETIEYFSQILPDFDRDRVYVSDIKKVIKWFNFLRERDLLSDSEADNASNESTGNDEEE